VGLSKGLSTGAFGLALAAALSGCASPPVWRIYDACAAQTSGFTAMVECGKAKRQAACEEHHDCSDVGNAFVQYADALAAQVQSHQITEADAMARFAEYKTKLISDQQRNEAIAAAAAPPVVVQQAPPPVILPPRY
jgi:hypothetical protein